ncbi:hypothetical protein O181_111624 [Austropuccinia psidii MF-1]|uniref:Tf2-1-like SH3-like domain-containing protein n=1 Tax=Austropuccinia psidii MF-1 TaxID=1389203 RepID=A0A9Q3PRZ1_9BASI|nr:hypothetical protein [Austropuccinia psidii MF-1]
MEPDFKEGSQVLVSTLKFNNLKGPKKMRDSFVEPFNIINLIGKNAVEVKLTEEFSRNHPVFPVSLVKPYFQTEEDKFPSRKKKSHSTRNSGRGRLPWSCEENHQGQEDQTEWSRPKEILGQI